MRQDIDMSTSTPRVGWVNDQLQIKMCYFTGVQASMPAAFLMRSKVRWQAANLADTCTQLQDHCDGYRGKRQHTVVL